MYIYICNKKETGIKNKCLKELVLRKIIGKEHLSIKKYTYGKPFLNEYSKIHFSISHSKNFWVLAADNKPIGIDIECIRFVKNFNDKIELFNKQEYEYLLNNKKSFFRIWCGKESYLKLLGTGLNTSLKSFSVIDNNNFKTSIGIFNLFYLNLIEGYEIAVCTPNNINYNNLKIVFLN